MKGSSCIVDFFGNELKRSALLVTVSLISLVLSFAMGRFGAMGPEWADPAWVAIALCGVPILYDAVTGLVLRHDIKADVLVAMALVASVAMGEYFAAGEVAFIMSLGGLLEDYSAARSRRGIEALVRMVPQTAIVVRDGRDVTVPAAEVRVGEHVRVLAGGTVPLDGRIVVGRTSIDQSSLTGESMPVDKGEGDTVFSGTVNQMGTFVMEVTETASGSSFQRLVAMVESADADRTEVVRTADRWATYLVILVAAVTVAAYVLSGDIRRALTVMVVFCPCAFILATPTAVVAAIGNLAHRNVLVRNGDALQKMASVDRVAFDKTGTLTEGRPAVTGVFSAGGMSPERIRFFAASAESLSEHPLGKAIASGIDADVPEEFSVTAGGGVSARVCGKTVMVGSAGFLSASGAEVSGKISKIADDAAAEGLTAAVVAVDGVSEGVITLSDPIRPGAADAVGKIRSEGAECVLLTGDGPGPAGIIAGQAGISAVKAGCRPEDKLKEVRSLRADGHRVCMVGDGINDAPALRAADVGIAMGGTGTGIALEAADMVLVGDEIGRIPHLRYVSGRMMAKIRNNIIFAMCWNTAAVALAVLGAIDPVTGAVVHNIGSVAVVANSFLLLKAERRTRGTGSSVSQTFINKKKIRFPGVPVNGKKE